MKAYISLGSNQGDREANLRGALEELNRPPEIEVRRISRFIDTEPEGVKDQPVFLNAVAELETCLEPEPLLDRLLQVERAFGRVRSRRWGPRTLDLDLILFEDRRLKTNRLEVPHPRLHERRFVLEPLAELAPDQVVPGEGRTVRQLLREVAA